LGVKLTDFKALTFDCYGTLIDWESGIIDALTPLTGRASQMLARDQIHEAQQRQESKQQLFTPGKPYDQLLAVVYKRLAEEWGVSSTRDECEAYGQSIRFWPAFPDSAASLSYPKQHYRLIVLSNVDNRSFASSREKLGVEFDAIYTAEDIGSYKPSPRNFEYMLDHLADLKLDRSDILHTAESLFHDHVPARRLDLATCWSYRRHQPQGFGATMNPQEAPRTDFRFNSMADLVSAHRSELEGRD
jgi:2-haloalkanoic acid dehalogenase type II